MDVEFVWEINDHVVFDKYYSTVLLISILQSYSHGKVFHQFSSYQVVGKVGKQSPAWVDR